MTESKPNVLILGATGKVGGETARLLAQTNDVHAIAGVRSPEKAQHLTETGIELRVLDLDRHDRSKSQVTSLKWFQAPRFIYGD